MSAQSVGQDGFIEDLSHRIGQGCHRTQVGSNRLQAGFVECQPVQQRRAQASFPGSNQVTLVLFEDIR